MNRHTEACWDLHTGEGGGSNFQFCSLVIQLVPHERIQERIAEQVVDMLLPQLMRKCCFLPRTRQNRTVEQIVDVSILQMHEKTSQLASFGMHSTWHRFCVLSHPFPSLEHAPNDVVGKVPVRSCRLSSEDCRTPFNGQAVKQSAEMRSALKFFGTAQSCRERQFPSTVLSLAVWLELAQLHVLRNWQETEAYKNDVHLLPTAR